MEHQVCQSDIFLPKLLQAERLTPAGVTLWLTWQLGLRLEEIVTLRWDQLHGETLRLPDRIVPLTSGVLGVLSDLRAASPDAVYILTAPRSGRPYDRTRLSKIVRTALVRAGLDNITLRDLRLDCDIRVGGENEVTAFLRRHQSITRNEAAELLRDRELDVDLYVLGSTQEETHSTGAIAAAYGIAPDCCVAVDVTHGDSPDASKDKTFPLGGGPVIGLGPNCTRWMARRLERKAEELGLDVQLEVMAGSSGTNGWPMQISREGIATAVLSLPLRYMHTPIETVHRDDLDHTAQLLAAFLEGLGEEAEAL